MIWWIFHHRLFLEFYITWFRKFMQLTVDHSHYIFENRLTLFPCTNQNIFLLWNLGNIISIQSCWGNSYCESRISQMTKLFVFIFEDGCRFFLLTSFRDELWKPNSRTLSKIPPSCMFFNKWQLWWSVYLGSSMNQRRRDGFVKLICDAI